MRILSGIQPSGKLHLGNYLGEKLGSGHALCIEWQGKKKRLKVDDPRSIGK
jgi:lysyl-tRNA synthetase class I